MRQLSVRSVAIGAAYALAISGAAGIAQFVIDSPGWRGVFFLAVLFGFFFGGFVAGRGHAGRAARHGAVAAAVAFVVFQGIASTRRIFAGEDVSIIGVVFNAFTAAVCGSLGGMLATRSPGPEAVRRARSSGAG